MRIRRHRKTRRQTKKQRKIIIISLVCFMFIMAGGYAAFQTNLNITAKGNIKDSYSIIQFKTQLLENNTFEAGTSGWQKNGCSTGGFEISDTITYKGYKSVRIYENGGYTNCWNGIRQLINRSFDTSKKYELSLYMYRDNSSTFGDLNNTIREYASLGDENTSNQVWIWLEKSRYSAINITKDIVANKEWTYFEDNGNRASNNNYPSNMIRSFHIDYLASSSRTEISNVWVALPSLYEVEEKEVQKYKKIGVLPTAYKEGYEFVGWYTDEFDGEKISEDTIIEDNASYYARFIKVS